MFPKEWSRAHFLICCGCAIVTVVLILYFVSDFNPNVDQTSSYAVKNNHHFNAYERLHSIIEANNNNLEDDPKLLQKNGYNYHKSGYGIVFDATLDTLRFIYISISIMNYLNITYPIEIYLNELDGKNEQDIMDKCSKYFETFTDMNIQCKFCHHHPIEKDSYKAFYLLDSSFQHVLYLDFYTMIIQQPNILFDSDEYNLNHAIFWPNKCEQAMQIVIDTLLYHNMLNIVIDCIDSNNYPFNDCFKLMWLNKQQSFYFVDIQPQYIGIMDINQTFYATSLFQFWLNDNSLYTEGKLNNNPMFIHQLKSMKSINNKLWKYYQEVLGDRKCVKSLNKSDNEYKYKVDTIKENKVNDELIAELELKWIEFWNETMQVETIFS
eukprot:179824_1